MKFIKLRLLIIFLLMAMAARAQRLDTLVEAGTSRLHFKIFKGPHPPILFESGGGMDASQWDSIAVAVHEQLRATVITYDRAGFGKSSMDTLRYNIRQEVGGLEMALKTLGYQEADFLLVGHSLGGFYNRVFAARHSRQVKGIILLDPRVPSQADMTFARHYFQSLNRKDFEPDYLSLYHLLKNMERTSDEVRLIPWPAKVPILDIMAEHGPFSNPSENERFQADQRSMVENFPNRKLILAEGSSHNIPQDRPGLVIAQIIDFYKGNMLMK